MSECLECRKKISWFDHIRSRYRVCIEEGCKKELCLTCLKRPSPSIAKCEECEYKYCNEHFKGHFKECNQNERDEDEKEVKEVYEYCEGEFIVISSVSRNNLFKQIKEYESKGYILIQFSQENSEREDEALMRRKH